MAYNLSAGILVVVIYTHWTNGFPWDLAYSDNLTVQQERLGWLVWTVLLAGVLLGIRRLWLWPEARRDPRDQIHGIGLDAASMNPSVRE
jgi:hypothetical protein